jgi:hypothetical protein
MVGSIDQLELKSLLPTGIQDYFDTGQSEASSVHGQSAIWRLPLTMGADL